MIFFFFKKRRTDDGYQHNRGHTIGGHLYSRTAGLPRPSERVRSRDFRDETENETSGKQEFHRGRVRELSRFGILRDPFALQSRFHASAPSFRGTKFDFFSTISLYVL